MHCDGRVGVALESSGGRRKTVSAHTVGETRKINVLVVGESPRLFSSFRRLERLGCECHFAESHREVSALLSHTKLDIVLSLYTQEGYLKSWLSWQFYV